MSGKKNNKPNSGKEADKVLEELSAFNILSPKRKREEDLLGHSSKLQKPEPKARRADLLSINDDQYLSEVDDLKSDTADENIKDSVPESEDDKVLNSEEVPARDYIAKKVDGLLGPRNTNNRPMEGSPPALFEGNPDDYFTPVSTVNSEKQVVDLTKQDSKDIAKTNEPEDDVKMDTEDDTNNDESNKSFNNSTETLTDTFVVAPADYPNIVITENHKATISKYLNDSSRTMSRRSDQDIVCDRFMHRSGVIVFRTSDGLSSDWVRFMVEDRQWNDLGFNLVVINERDFVFAPAYTAWVPDDSSSFEYLMRKARHNGVNTSTWRFVRIITEKGRPQVIGKKFSFIALGNLEDRLGEKRELRFHFDFNQQRAVIKAAGSGAGAVRPRNSRNGTRPDYAQELEAAQDRFELYRQTLQGKNRIGNDQAHGSGHE